MRKILIGGSMTLSIASANPSDFKAPEYCLPIDGALHHENFLPASSIVDPDHIELGNLITKEKLLFCYRAILRTIDSCLAKKYSEFDGHTTSNCCHGMALLAQHLINDALVFNLNELHEEGEQKIASIEQQSDPRIHCTWWVPKALINLSCLYILAFVKESDPLKGGRTVTKKLKDISPISVNICNEIAHKQKKIFSNWIALQYQNYLKEINEDFQMNNAPIGLWGKYISEDYIRTDKRGLKYCSNLFSVQVSLAHLIFSGAKIALVNDIIDSSGQVVDRYVAVFEGDGKQQFKNLSSLEIKSEYCLNPSEPVVVFGGCVYSDTLDKDSLSVQMKPWLNKFTSLMLGCDVYYPQFFKVTDDSEFNSEPIVAEEKVLRDIINAHLQIKGVSADNPSLYCSTHTFTASLEQLVKILSEEDKHALPFSFIPGLKRDSSLWQ